ncbi:hypothetical protein GCM10007386_55670 [Pseudoduganella dura]|nr:hypothetical protein GCM10007386_55670 [Pseudoduganella dura]
MLVIPKEKICKIPEHWVGGMPPCKYKRLDSVDCLTQLYDVIANVSQQPGEIWRPKDVWTRSGAFVANIAEALKQRLYDLAHAHVAHASKHGFMTN